MRKEPITQGAFAKVLRVTACLLIVGILFSCTSTSPYDPATKENLETLKGKVFSLYDEFAAGPVDKAKIEKTQKEIMNFYFEEHEKGLANATTIEYAERIGIIFEDHMAHRRKGIWSEQALFEFKNEIGLYIDRAIVIERFKSEPEAE